MTEQSNQPADDYRQPFTHYPGVYIPGTKIPCLCPVCNGKGIVTPGFYTSIGEKMVSSSTGPEPCKACEGTGIIWSR